MGTRKIAISIVVILVGLAQVGAKQVFSGTVTDVTIYVSDAGVGGIVKIDYPAMVDITYHSGLPTGDLQLSPSGTIYVNDSDNRHRISADLLSYEAFNSNEQPRTGSWLVRDSRTLITATTYGAELTGGLITIYDENDDGYANGYNEAELYIPITSIKTFAFKGTDYSQVYYINSTTGMMFQAPWQVGGTSTMFASDNLLLNAEFLTYHPNGNFYAINGNKIITISNDGTVVSELVIDGGNPLIDPVQLTIADDGYIYIADRGVNNVFRISPTSGTATMLLSPGVLFDPRGIAVLVEINQTGTYHVDGVTGDDVTGDGLSRGTAFATIQKGIDTAVDGDEVLVWPGVYTEDVNFLNKAITVRSAAEPAVLEALNLNAVSFFSGEDPNSVLKNFIITNSDTGIFIVASDPTISNVTVVGNNTGIEGFTGADPQITNSILWNNPSGDLSGGLVPLLATHSWVEEEVLPDGLVSCWKLDGDATDSVGNNDGTLQGDPNWVSGKIGDYALDFDGVDNYIELPDNEPVWLPQNNFTALLWVYFKRDASSDRTDVLLDLNYADSGDPSNEVGSSFTRKETGKLRFAMTTTTNPDEDLFSNDVLVKDTWYHIVAVRGGTTQAIYINGQLDASRTCSPDPIKFVGGYDNDKVHIGKFSRLGNPGGGYPDAVIDDVCIYDRALSAGEIGQLYKVGLEGHSYDEPMFVDGAGGDYRLKSEGWRWSPMVDNWTWDDVTSSCVDGGNSGTPLRDELMVVARDPGNVYGENVRVNMGAYGGTSQASMGPIDWALLADLNNDGVVDALDLAGQVGDWLMVGIEQPGDLNWDGVVDLLDFGIAGQEWLMETIWR